MGTTIQDKTSRPPVVAGLTPYTGTFGKEQITHLLKRTMFGAKKADIDFFTGKTLSEVITALLTEPAALTNAQLPLNNYERKDTANAANDKLDTDAPLGSTWAYKNQGGPVNSGLNFDGERRASLKAWWLGNMVTQQRSVFEKMVLFWHNHFATEITDTASSMFFEYVMLLRQNALGNFKTFTKGMTAESNMLRYLNGYLNTKSAPDENYGRELQELFTMGKGANSQYTEADVKAAARVLTGFSLRQVQNPAGSGIYKYESYWRGTGQHDLNPKVFSVFYGTKTISTVGGDTAAAALKEVDDLHEMIFAQNEVAMYVCRRIYRFFVYYDIDATVETDVITPLAAIFRANNYDIKPVLKALFSSEHFFDVGLKACLIKSPLENLVGFVREFEIVLPANTVTPSVQGTLTYQENQFYTSMNSLLGNASAQAQNLGDPPNVSGWPAYYQEPVFHEAWINTDTFPKRLRYSDSFFLGSVSRMSIDFLKFTDQFGTDAEDPNLLITRVLEILYRVPPTQAMLNYLKTTILLGGQASDHYWTDAWVAYKASPTLANTNIVKLRLQSFYLFITRNPEYQLA